MKGSHDDPKGLIYESYRMEEIGKSECRTIFLDWALSLPLESDTGQTIRALLAQYNSTFPDHPMTEVLKEGLTTMQTPRRRGGWRSRTRN
jgi:hypothetical protein